MQKSITILVSVTYSADLQHKEPPLAPRGLRLLAWQLCSGANVFSPHPTSPLGHVFSLCRPVSS